MSTSTVFYKDVGVRNFKRQLLVEDDEEMYPKVKKMISISIIGFILMSPSFVNTVKRDSNTLI